MANGKAGKLTARQLDFVSGTKQANLHAFAEPNDITRLERYSSFRTCAMFSQ